MTNRLLAILLVTALTSLTAANSRAAKPGKGSGNTVTTLTSSANPAAFAAPVTLTATVIGGVATPTGTVLFRDGGVTLGNVPLDGGGVATLETSSLSAGNHSITATYSGNADYSDSSAALTQTVAPPAIKADQTITFNQPGTRNYGDAPFPLTATASSGLPVTYTVTSGPGSLSGNILTITGVGTIKVTASQPGDDNYNPAPDALRSFTVLPPSLSVVGITANDKTYDGTVAATLNTAGATLIGILPGDDVTLDTSAVTGSFADKNVGANKTVTVSGLTLAGAQAGNYALAAPTTTASITAATVSGTVTVEDKVYDGTTSAVVASRGISGAVPGDDVSLSCGAADFCDPLAGTGKLVTVVGLNLAGANAANYELNSTTATTTASIIVLQAPSLTLNRAPDGTVTLTSSGTVGQAFSVQATTSLSSPEWTTISVNVIGEDGNATFVDEEASQHAARFYRTMISF